MPKNEVSDPITDQEIAFAHLVLSGALTDRQAAEAVGLNPDAAASTKAKPQVHAYILEHRAAEQQQLVQQDAKQQQLPNLDRQQVLDRLWEIANLSPEITRGSVTGQVKALTIIVAMENFIPNRLAASAEKKSAAPTPRIHASEVAGPAQSTTSKAPVPYVPLFNSAPDLGLDFPTKKTPLNPFVRPR
jgi:transcription initiation factor TFIID subunit TAF12